MRTLIARPDSAATAMREATRRGHIELRWDRRFNGVKVFSATMEGEWEPLRAAASAWIDQHAELELVDITITTSGEASSPCMAIVITYWDPGQCVPRS